MKCCLCKQNFSASWHREAHNGTLQLGNNAEPLARGRCCDQCNWQKVIHARMAQLEGSLGTAAKEKL